MKKGVGNTSTHKGSTAFGHLSWMARPWEKSITSSSVPWITSTGDVTFETLSMLSGKKANGYSRSIDSIQLFMGRQRSHHYTFLDIMFTTYLGKASKHQVRCVLGKATRIPDIKGECNITAPTSYLKCITFWWCRKINLNFLKINLFTEMPNRRWELFQYFGHKEWHFLEKFHILFSRHAKQHQHLHRDFSLKASLCSYRSQHNHNWKFQMKIIKHFR